jgi:serine/threonine protein kinase
MSPQDPRDAFLSAIEQQTELSGRFVEIRRLGNLGGGGAFSLILHCLDQQSGNRVALKFFDPQCQDPYRLHSFRREAEVLAQLVGEPDIIQWVAPIDSFTLQLDYNGLKIPLSFSYYALELASGSVDAAIASDKWSLLTKLERYRSMCRSVQRIHAAGMVHRDIKLSNFLIRRDGTVVLSDFGTARLLADPSGALAPRYGIPVGDTTYSAPELFAALQDVDPTLYYGSDIYALGAALFEMLSGTPLNPLIFDSATLNDLVTMMNAVSRADRIRIYNSFVSAMEASRPLPPLSYSAVQLPGGVAGILDGLYRGMCAIDYRKRVCDFQRIFSHINRTLIILRNEAKYQEWQRRRQLYKAKAEEKRQRLSAKQERGVKLC